MEIFEISYKLYVFTKEGYKCFGEGLELNELYALMKETLKRGLLKRFLIIQKVNNGECPIFYGDKESDFAVFKNEAFIPFVRTKKEHTKKKIKNKQK